MVPQGKLNSGLVPVAAFVLLGLGLVAVNVLAAFVPLRADVTEEGLYTLSAGSRAIVGKLEDPVTIKLYYSESLPDVPVAFKSYSSKVIELLREFEAHAGGKLTLETFDPKPDTEEEEWATRYGLTPARMPNGGSLYFGMVAIAVDREGTVPFFDPRREKFLEYDIAQTLGRIGHAGKEKIGLLSFLPIMGFGGPMFGGMRQQQPDWVVLQELRKSYEVELLQPNNLVEVPEEMRMVMVVHPKALPEAASYALDQFLLRGGKLMVFVDPNARLDSGAQVQYGGPTNSNLEALFQAWGVKFDGMNIVGDTELATRVNAPQQGVIDYPVWITVNANYLNHDQVITSELEELTLIDAGAFEPEKDFAYQFTPLITSSANSGTVDFTAVRMMNPATLARMIKPDGTKRILAAMITGTFQSAYPGGPPPPPKAEGKEGEKQEPPGKPTLPHLAVGRQDSTVVLVGDADFMADQFSINQVNFFGNVVSQPINDNLNFVLNAAEFLMGSQELIHIRSRGQFSRPFTRVAELQVQAAARYRTEEERLSQQLEEVKRKLSELERQKPTGEKVILSPEQLEAVRTYRLEEQRTSKALREVRKVLRQDIESLGNNLLAVNMLVVPLLVAVGGFLVIFRRTRRSGGKP
jgi:ABC-type uncharacterized transport system involved in gliding motility auxiliary subunit